MLGNNVDRLGQCLTQLALYERFIWGPTSDLDKRLFYVRGQFGFVAKLDHAFAAVGQVFTVLAITLPESFSATRNS